MLKRRTFLNLLLGLGVGNLLPVETASKPLQKSNKVWKKSIWTAEKMKILKNSI